MTFLRFCAAVYCGAYLFLPASAFAVDCSTLSSWTSSAVYVGNDQVQHAGSAYRAKWWTQNQNPINHSQQWDVWAVLGTCGDTPTNQAPTAQINGPYQALVGEAVSFSSVGSADADGSITGFQWQFGDGTSSSMANPQHAYTAAGTYTVTLTVTDNQGASSVASTSALISDDTGGEPGSCDGVAAYVAGTSYAAGDVVSNTGKRFECLVAGWCSSSAAWAYEPGVGAHWGDAWAELGDCQTGGGNQSPVAEINGPYYGQVNQSVNFSSAGSNDADGTITSYSWSFGDGAQSTQASPSHSYTNTGTYTVTLTVTDNDGAATTVSTVANINDGSSNGGPLAHRVLVGYWHNFVNQAGYLPIGSVSDDWDIVNLSFAENKLGGQPGEVAFAPAEESEAAFIAGVQMLQARGQKVLISLGGANAHITLDNVTERDNFVRTMGDIIARYGLDGMDIDLEGGSLNMNPGDTVANPQTPAIVNLIEATRQLKARFGSNFILTMAPETAYVQGGYANFGGIWGAYLPLIHALRNDLNLLHVQHYNTGSILATDDVAYNAGTADFHVALSDMMITGFPAGRDANNFFPGLRADQVAVGLPATPGAASSGLTSSSVVHAALDCLIMRTSCGAYVPAQAHPDFRGLMTWSITWDAYGGGSFSTPHRAYLDANP